ncbi:ABC transporter permease [Fusibacter ferrireducens]|uniref:FtsX-like permease family protein n=1 Tax=Fusibacter ferrireducens TaxID=2785058 RepID=A0ABR9ZSC0_9FIRM|nr:FtsX-like permease family protein [Fusibacter ferrireducens]MBF4693358.1 FtsX-like permease family protein [Fusibacter ferrireducens]
MNRFKYSFMIKRNIKFWKKTWLKSCFIMILVGFLMITVGSLADSLVEHANTNIFRTPGFRSIMVSMDDQENWPVVLDKLEVYKKSNPSVLSLKEETWGAIVTVNNLFDFVKDEDIKNQIRIGELFTSDEYYIDERFLLDGRWFDEGETGVVIIPKTFSFNAISESYFKLDINYLDGSDFIGQTFKISYFTYKESNGKLVPDQEFKRDFKVIGVYDNTKTFSLSCDIILKYDDLKSMVQTIRTGEVYSGGSEFHTYRMMVDQIGNVDKVISDIDTLIKPYNGVAMLKSRPGSGFDLINPFIKSSFVTSLFLFGVSMILQIILIKQMLNQRTREIGLLMVFGYTKKQVVRLYLAEIAAWGGLSFIIATGMSALTLSVIRLLIFFKGSLRYKNMVIELSGNQLLYILSVMLIVLMVSALLNLKRIMRIEPKEAVVLK